MSDFLLLEDGAVLLLEDGAGLLLEDATFAPLFHIVTANLLPSPWSATLQPSPNRGNTGRSPWQADLTP